MAARTQRIYRDEGLFEQLSAGAAEFSTLGVAGYSRNLSLVTLILFTALIWILALLLYNNPGTGWTGLVAIWLTFTIAATAAVRLVLRLARRLNALRIRLLHHPVPVIIDEYGVRQTRADGETVVLNWEDIRLVQHRRSAHLVRGEKKQKIKISTQLSDHEILAAFLQFAFLLRQEIGPDWRGLLPEVRARLEGTGFHFHYDPERTDTVSVDMNGIRHSPPRGEDSEMPWDLMQNSIIEPTRNMLRFRHPGTQTTLVLPRGTDSDPLVEEFIRWALHTGPGFGDPAS